MVPVCVIRTRFLQQTMILAKPKLNVSHRPLALHFSIFYAPIPIFDRLKQLHKCTNDFSANTLNLEFEDFAPNDGHAKSLL